MKQQLIMIAGPYKSGTLNGADRERNLRRLFDAAAEIYKRGHIPVIAVNAALPIIERMGDPSRFDEIMMKVAKGLAKRCDACLRIEGASKGADEEVKVFRLGGKPVYFALEQIPNLK